MKKINVSICLGTTCFVLGSSKLQNLEDYLPEHMLPFVEIQGVPCLNLCTNFKYPKAPYVQVDNEIISEATVEKILACIASKVISETGGKE